MVFLQQHINPKRETYCVEYKSVHSPYRCPTHNTICSCLDSVCLLWEPEASVATHCAHDEHEVRKNLQSEQYC